MKLLDNLIWLRNRAWSLDVKVPRLMFYHIPKTGGMAVYHPVRYALIELSRNISRQNPGFPEYKAARIDTQEAMGLVDSLMLVATHLPYGWHLNYKSAPQYQLITVLRDPFERVLSHYTYDCMRNGRPVAVADFLNFATRPENRNVMVRYFCGSTLDCRLDVTAAIGILERDFLAYDTTDNIPDLIEGLLNYANLPNVMMAGKINHTLAEYKLEVPELRPQVEALNSADLEFYREIQAHPRRLPIPSLDGYHPLTCLLKEVGESDRSLVPCRSIMTTELLDVVARVSSADEVFTTFFKPEELSPSNLR